MGFEASGDRGALFVGYQRAADVRAWHLVRREECLNDPVSVLTGRLEKVDRFWISRRSFAVRLRLGESCWTWEEAELQHSDPLAIWLYHDPKVSPWRENGPK